MTLRRPITLTRQQQGLSLVEIMVALTIGLILMAGVIQVFISSRATFNSQEAVARVQESGRFAIDFISRDMRMAGHSGCPRDLPPDMTVMANDADEDRLTSRDYLRGTENGLGDNNFWDDEPDDLVNGAEAFRVTFASGADVTAVNFDSSAEFDIDGNPLGFRQNDFLLVTDCDQAHVLEITNNIDDDDGKVNISHSQGGGSDGGGNNPHTWNNLGNPYDGDLEPSVMRMHEYTYYIATNPRGVPALYRRDTMRSDGQADVEELVENVEMMYVEYGIDTNGDRNANDYQTANGVGDWQRVVSARVMLLVRSDDILAEERQQSFDVGGDTIAATDRRLRQVYSTTVTLRNQAN